jgi:hypothetical protein
VHFFFHPFAITMGRKRPKTSAPKGSVGSVGKKQKSGKFIICSHICIGIEQPFP